MQRITNTKTIHENRKLSGKSSKFEISITYIYFSAANSCASKLKETLKQNIPGKVFNGEHMEHYMHSTVSFFFSFILV